MSLVDQINSSEVRNELGNGDSGQVQELSDKQAGSPRVASGAEDGDYDNSAAEVEAYHPTPYLIDDAWKEVFGKLQKPKDLLSVCQASAFFNWVLDDIKTVLQLEVCLPFLWSYLDRNTVLNCRQVCKRIKTCVNSIQDQLLVNKIWVNQDASDLSFPSLAPQPLIFDFNVEYYRPNCCVDINLDEDSVDSGIQADRLPKLMEDLRKGCSLIELVGKQLKVYMSASQEQLEMILELLSLWNMRIDHLNFRMIFRQHMTALELYSVIRRIFHAAPNLRMFSGCFHDLIVQHVHQDGDNVLSALSQYIQENPLPGMKRLDSLSVEARVFARDFDGSKEYHPVYQELLARYGAQLEHAFFIGRGLAPIPFDSFWSRPFLNLKSLLTTFHLESGNLPKWINAPNLVHLHAVLVMSELMLHQADFCSKDFPNGLNIGSQSSSWIQTFFEFLRHFSSIKQLELDVRFPNEFISRFASRQHVQKLNEAKWWSKLYHFRHKSLKHLILDAWFFIFPSSHWLPYIFPKLETILVRTIDFRMLLMSFGDNFCLDRSLLLTGNMYQSCLWTKIPTLKMIRYAVYDSNEYEEDDKISDDVYTRQGFLDYVAPLTTEDEEEDDDREDAGVVAE